MSAVVVIIYDCPKTISVPLSVRAAWLRALYPAVRVIEAWDGPTEVGYTPEIMKAQERYVLENLQIRGITHFYSSEPYGAHMSQALGAIDRRVDEGRHTVPISATAIREDPFRYRSYLLRGDLEERVRRVRHILDGFHKYGNLLDLVATAGT